MAKMAVILGFYFRNTLFDKMLGKEEVVKGAIVSLFMNLEVVIPLWPQIRGASSWISCVDGIPDGV
jgi:hypothetical protein